MGKIEIKQESDKMVDLAFESGSTEELNKCLASPYYYAMNYLTLNGKPFKTNLTEEEYNERFKFLANGYYNKTCG